MGRVVISHSTYVEGLIPWLKSLATDPNIMTITPGVICRSRGQCAKLELRISIPIRGGHKLIARKGKSTQEVFVITNLTKKQLEELIDNHRY